MNFLRDTEMKKSLLLIATLVLGAVGTAQAEDDASVNRGSAKSFFCTSCHGYNGMGTKSAPALAGQDEVVLSAKLTHRKKKKSSIMGAQLAKFSAPDLLDLAAYFSSLKEAPRGSASFERDIQPIIEWRCLACHSGEGEGEKKSGLNLASYNALMAGTKQGGDLIVAGSSLSSTFFTMITRRDSLRMPYGAPPLADDEVRVIDKWISQGAKNN